MRRFCIRRQRRPAEAVDEETGRAQLLAGLGHVPVAQGTVGARERGTDRRQARIIGALEIRHHPALVAPDARVDLLRQDEPLDAPPPGTDGKPSGG